MPRSSNLTHDLFEAVRQDDRRRVDDLLQQGANIESTEEEGTTPLQLAAGLGLAEMAKHLVARGANINAVNDRGGTVLFLARAAYTIASKTGASSPASERLELVQWLRDHGAADTPGTEPKRGCAVQAVFVVVMISAFLWIAAAIV